MTKKEKIIVKNGQITAFWLKHGRTRYFGKITAFDKNHCFRVSLIFYCPSSINQPSVYSSRAATASQIESLVSLVLVVCLKTVYVST